MASHALISIQSYLIRIETYVQRNVLKPISNFNVYFLVHNVTSHKNKSCQWKTEFYYCLHLCLANQISKPYNWLF